METKHTPESPLLLNAGGDFAHLKIVRYKDRFLYSKYNPLRTVTALIKATDFLPGTIVLVCAPCLWYGLNELCAALPHSCTIVAVQDDAELFSLATNSLASYGKQGDTELRLFSTQDLQELDGCLRKLAGTGQYRRVLRLDFSAGVQLNPAIYNAITVAAQEIITSFWLNRVTLVKMGRLFAKNMFQNLPRLKDDSQLADLAKSIQKPILVCGAGESLDETLGKLQAEERSLIKKAFIIVVDAALSAVLARGIIPDAVVSLESQSIIRKAYIGTAQHWLAALPPLLFADIASLPAVTRDFAARTVWFASKYTEAGFLDRLSAAGIVAAYSKPLGSVGLSAVDIALTLRTDSSVPIFVTGLDFSYSMGRTHAKDTPHHHSRLNASNRLHPIAHYDAAFAAGTFFIQDKRGLPMITSKVMKAYADTFAGMFRSKESLFDIGASGIPLGIPRCPYPKEQFLHILGTWQESASADISPQNPDRSRGKNTAAFYADEKKALETLRDLLVHGEESAYRNKAISLDAQISAALCGREYLYLHFPDGYAPSTALSFLKRVRVEIDFFLKQIAKAD